MDQPTIDIVHNRAVPLLKEVFDGFVLLGYHTNKEGKRIRVVLFDNTVKADGKTGDAAVADGLAIPLAQAVQWSRGGAQNISVHSE